MENDNKIIDALGGTAAVAYIFGITPGAVSQWRPTKDNPDARIPRARMMYLEVKYPKIVLPNTRDSLPDVTASPSA